MLNPAGYAGEGGGGIGDPSELGTMFGRWSILPGGVLLPTTPGVATHWANNDVSAPFGADMDWDDANVDPYYIVNEPTTVSGAGVVNAPVMFHAGGGGLNRGFRIDLRHASMADELAALRTMQTGAAYALIRQTAFTNGPVWFAASNDFAARYLRFTTSTTGQLRAVIGRPHGDTQEDTWTSVATPVLANNTWQVVAFVQDGIAMVGYCDGVAYPMTHNKLSTNGLPGDWFADVEGVTNKVNGISIGLSAESDGGGIVSGIVGDLAEVGVYNGVAPDAAAMAELNTYLREAHLP